MQKKPFAVEVTRCQYDRSSISNPCHLSSFETQEGDNVYTRAHGTGSPEVIITMQTGTETRKFTVMGLDCPEEPQVGEISPTIRHHKGMLTNTITVDIACTKAANKKTTNNTDYDGDDECSNPRLSRKQKKVCWKDGWRKR
jgi:hypothetical protein